MRDLFVKAYPLDIIQPPLEGLAGVDCILHLTFVAYKKYGDIDIKMALTERQGDTLLLIN